MLNADTILPLLKDIENERIERTTSKDAKKKFGQAICAFANDIMNTGVPGYLFIGTKTLALNEFALSFSKTIYSLNFITWNSLRNSPWSARDRNL